MKNSNNKVFCKMFCINFTPNAKYLKSRGTTKSVKWKKPFSIWSQQKKKKVVNSQLPLEIFTEIPTLHSC